MQNKDEILAKLKEKPAENVNIRNFINNYGVDSSAFVNDSLFIRGTSDKQWVYFSCFNESDFRVLENMLTPDDMYFAVIEDWQLKILLEKRKLIWKLTTLRLIFPDKEPEEKISPEYVCRPLSTIDAGYIYDNSRYKKYTSLSYIKQRIKSGPSIGLFQKNALLGWILTYDDGAMGFLHVLDDYRRKGLGTQITVAMIKHLKSKGEIPFVHIEEDNINSLRLAWKLGFEKDRTIHWIKSEVKTEVKPELKTELKGDK